MDLFRRLIALFTRAEVVGVTEGSALRKLQIKGMGGLVRSEVEHAEPYGFTSRPFVGAEAFVGNVNASSDHAVALIVTDRRYRPITLASGAVAMYHADGYGILLDATKVSIGSPTGTPIDLGGNTIVAGTLQATVSMSAPAGTFATLGFTSLSGGGGISGGAGLLAAPTINATTAFQANGVPGATGSFLTGAGQTVTYSKGLITGVV